MERVLGNRISTIGPTWRPRVTLCRTRRRWKNALRAVPSSEGGPEKLEFSIFSEQPQIDAPVLDSTPAPITPSDGVPVKGATTDAGQVTAVEGGVVMIEGLSVEAPIGTQLEFESGQLGVLLWRYDSEVAFGMAIEGDAPNVHDSVQCTLTSSSQGDGVKEYQKFEIETGVHLRGEILQNPFKQSPTRGTPLLNRELDMASRQCIYEPLSMQHRGIDILTPVGRGQCILLISQEEDTLDALSEHLLAAQGESIFTVYASISKSTHHQTQIQSRFSASDAVLIQADVKDSLAYRFATLCAALSLGEAIRDAGGDAFVVLDDLSPLPEIWNLMQRSYATRSNTQDGGGEELVEVNGTFMEAKTAERRRFFSSVLQRAAKVSEALGGGSLTLVPIVRGMPATGNPQKQLQAQLDAIEEDPELTEALKAKLREKLNPNQIHNPANTASTDSLPVYIVEELMSIADGQIVVGAVGAVGEGVSIDPLLSISRIGARAYPSALESLAPNIRLQLAQAADAVQFDSTAETSAAETWNLRIEALKEALIQRSGDLCPLSHQVVVLMALQTEVAQALPVTAIRAYLSNTVELFMDKHPAILHQIDQDQSLEPTLQQQIFQIIAQAG